MSDPGATCLSHSPLAKARERHRPRRYALLALVAVILAATAGCGSSSSPESAVSPSPTGAAVAEVAAAQAVVDGLLKAPTSLGVTDPLKAKPTSGTFVFLSCEQALCKLLDDNVKEAATAAGLNFKSIPVKSADPATFIAGMQQALQLEPKPIAVSFPGIPEAVWGSQIPAYAAAGVALVPVGVGETSKSPAIPAGSLNGPADITAQAKGIANYFIADSAGKGKVLVLNIPELGAFKQFTGDFKSIVSAGCTGCAVSTVDVTFSQIGSGGVVPAVVSALQRDPSVKYVVTVAGEFTQALPSAASAAGLTDLRVLGINPGIADQQAILAGSERAFMTIPMKILAWKAVDVALRAAQKMPVLDGDGPMPLQLLTKDTVGKPELSPDRPRDYRELFKKLWLVG